MEEAQINKIGIVFGPSAVEKRERADQFRQAMTPAEKRLWQFLRAGRLAGLHFRRQQVMDGFIVDFYCHRAGLIVEVDGSSYEGREDYDTARDQLLKTRGLRLLRFVNQDIFENPDRVLHNIYTTAQQAGLILPDYYLLNTE